MGQYHAARRLVNASHVSGYNLILNIYSLLSKHILSRLALLHQPLRHFQAQRLEAVGGAHHYLEIDDLAVRV